MIGVPFPTTRWDEIIPGLFQGGHDYQPDGIGTAVQDVIVRDEFDVVVSLFRRHKLSEVDYGPAEGTEHRIAPFLDGRLYARDLIDVRVTAVRAAEDVLAGKRVLVRCRAGYNRSGLVVAFALLRLEFEPDEAINLIRAKRSGYALSNGYFEKYVRDAA